MPILNFKFDRLIIWITETYNSYSLFMNIEYLYLINNANSTTAINIFMYLCMSKDILDLIFIRTQPRIKSYLIDISS